MELLLGFLPWLLHPTGVGLSCFWAGIVYFHTRGHTIVYNPRTRLVPPVALEVILRSVHTGRFLFHKASEYTHTLGKTLNLAFDVRYRQGGEVVDLSRRRRRRPPGPSAAAAAARRRSESASREDHDVPVSRDITSFDSILTDDED